jgi:hypothetical protein
MSALEPTPDVLEGRSERAIIAKDGLKTLHRFIDD